LWRPLLVALALLILGAAAAGAFYLVRDEHDGTQAQSTPPPPPAASDVNLQAVTAYDPPPGGGEERNDLLGLATDGNESTSWETEHYTTKEFGNLKQGVGIVVDAGKPVELGSLTVTSDTPGFDAVVKAGSSETGPFQTVSDPQTVHRRATFHVDSGSSERYYVVWITSLAYYPAGSGSKPYQVHISEITAS
jgi:hypothetical protein